MRSLLSNNNFIFFVFLLLYSCTTHKQKYLNNYSFEKVEKSISTELPLPIITFEAIFPIRNSKRNLISARKKALTLKDLLLMKDSAILANQNPRYDKIGIQYTSGFSINSIFKFSNEWKKFPKKGIELRNLNFCFTTSRGKHDVVDCYTANYYSFIGNYKYNKDSFPVDTILEYLKLYDTIHTFAIKYDIYVYEIRGKTRFIQKIGEDIQYFE